MITSPARAREHAKAAPANRTAGDGTTGERTHNGSKSRALTGPVTLRAWAESVPCEAADTLRRRSPT
ncbi:hypothetical protein AB0M86_49590 [Streptomyces sp. NPDC051639]|uniref:hypothetical protein n=1 Tax=unclassified Streptomyces TaxID=2593676 RepID=UPI003442881A